MVKKHLSKNPNILKKALKDLSRRMFWAEEQKWQRL